MRRLSASPRLRHQRRDSHRVRRDLLQLAGQRGGSLLQPIAERSEGISVGERGAQAENVAIGGQIGEKNVAVGVGRRSESNSNRKGAVDEVDGSNGGPAGMKWRVEGLPDA